MKSVYVVPCPVEESAEPLSGERKSLVGQSFVSSCPPVSSSDTSSPDSLIITLSQVRVLQGPPSREPACAGVRAGISGCAVGGAARCRGGGAAAETRAQYGRGADWGGAAGVADHRVGACAIERSARASSRQPQSETCGAFLKAGLIMNWPPRSVTAVGRALWEAKHRLRDRFEFDNPLRNRV